MNQNLYRKRRLTSLLGLTFSMSAMLVGLAVLGMALWEAMEALDWALVLEWAEEQWVALAV